MKKQKDSILGIIQFLLWASFINGPVITFQVCCQTIIDKFTKKTIKRKGKKWKQERRDR